MATSSAHTTGMGQGDISTLFPALALVFGQLYMVNQYYPQIRMGACIGDRNFRGRLLKILRKYEVISEYDRIAGQILQPDKTGIAATAAEDREAIKKLTLDGQAPKLVAHEVLVGDLVTTASRNSKSHVNSKIDKAYAMAVRLHLTPVPRSKKIAASCTAIIPKAIYATQWNLPSRAKSGRLRTAIIGNALGAGSKMRCIEILLACFYEPTRIDPALAALYRTFTHARRMTRKSIDRYGDFIRT